MIGKPYEIHMDSAVSRSYTHAKGWTNTIKEAFRNLIDIELYNELERLTGIARSLYITAGRKNFAHLHHPFQVFCIICRRFVS